MRLRDVVIVAAILAVAVFAIADAFRGDHRRPSEAAFGTTSPTTTAARENGGKPEPPQGLPAPGTIVFTDAQTCVLREFDVAIGTELPHGGLIRTNCFFTAPVVTGRVAVGLGGV